MGFWFPSRATRQNERDKTALRFEWVPLRDWRNPVCYVGGGPDDCLVLSGVKVNSFFFLFLFYSFFSLSSNKNCTCVGMKRLLPLLYGMGGKGEREKAHRMSWASRGRLWLLSLLLLITISMEKLGNWLAKYICTYIACWLARWFPNRANPLLCMYVLFDGVTRSWQPSKFIIHTYLCIIN